MLKKKSVFMSTAWRRWSLPASAGIDQHEHYKQEHEKLPHTSLVVVVLNNVQDEQIKTEMVPVNV